MEPDLIKNVPIPLLNADITTTGSNVVTPSPNSQNGVIPSTIPNNSIPDPIIAQHTISDTINTATRRILGTYSFGKVGAIQIGTFEAGVSGQISISPDGIIAKDSSGNTTFSLDGTTGDAIFVAGDVQIDSTGITLFNSTSLQLADVNAGNFGYFGPDGNTSNVLMQTAVGIGLKFDVNGDVTFQLGAFAQNNMTINANHVQFSNNASLSGSMDVSNQFSCQTLFINNHELFVQNGTTTIGNDGSTAFINNNGFIKTAIVKTSSGYNALYCAESPEVWFFDFALDHDSIDPMFLEVTEGEMKIIHCDDGSLQIWRRRKGYAKTRFEEKSAIQFMKNNLFWSQPL